MSHAHGETGTWIRTEPTVEILRLTDGGASVDRPSTMHFRDPVPVSEALEGIRGGGLRRVVTPDPDEFAARCGWYDGDGRTVLLTQIPEAYFGEPMCMLQDGPVVTRVYPIGDRELVRADGTRLTLHDGAIDLGGRRFTRTDRYREREVSFEGLAGTLIVPAGPGPHPAAVLVHGAAGGQRDFNRLFADALLDAGVAALIYDKPGHGRSAGAEPTIFEQAGAVSAALDALADEPDIDSGRLGIFGFSNGMWSTPIVAARRPEVAFIVGVGSPGVSMAEAEVHRRTKVLREAGIGAGTLALVADAWRCIFAIAAAGSASEDAQARLAALLKEVEAAADLQAYELPDYVRQNPMLTPVPPQLPMAELLDMIAGPPQPELSYDPASDYPGLRCPILLQYGADDTSVPVAESVERLAPVLRHPGSTIRVYPDLEHLLNVLSDRVTGMSPEEAAYLFHSFRYGDTVKADLTAWLRQNA